MDLKENDKKIEENETDLQGNSEIKLEDEIVVNPQSVDLTNKKAKRNKIIKTILLLLFFGATFYTIYAVSKTLSGGNIASLKEVLATPNPLYLTLLILIVCLIFFTDGMKYSVISKVTTNKFNFRFNMNVAVMGRFYDNITPLSTGGQPYQVYMYYKHGYPASVATVIPIVKYIFQLLTKIIVSMILFIANHHILEIIPDVQAKAVASLTYIGLIVASFLPILIILFSIFPNLINKIIQFVLKIGCKLKIVKDFDKTSKNVYDFLNSYRQAFLHIAKDFKGVVSLIIVSVLDFLTVMSVPYFVIIALGKTTPSMALFWDMITLNAYSLFAASLVPTPGNSGAIEGVASIAFAPIQMAEGALFWVVFIWRTFTYYIYIIIGLLKMLFGFIKRKINKKNKEV